MENQLQVFKHKQFGEVRTVSTNNEIWFVAKDITDALGLANTTVALQGLEDFERTKLNLGRQGLTNVVNESGMYALIIRSRKPQAKKFRIWVTSEVLPSIRKHGGYIQNQEEMTPELLMANALKLADSIIKEKDQALKEKEQQILEMKPKELFADAVTTSKSSILIGELAKLIKQNGYDIGQNRLFKWMREHGYLIKRKGENFNTPTQYSMNLGLMEIKKRTINNPDGSIRVTKTPKVTGKGQVYFINKFLSDDNSIQL